MGIISNAQFYTPYLFKWFLDFAPEDLGFDPELVFYSYEFERAKPSAALFAMAAQKLRDKGLAPSSVLYLGNDMLNDIFPAKNSGFQTALFAGDKRSLRLRTDDPRCRSLKPDLVVTDLGQLINIICK
jgi:putative hydrolase of the HAD superfamily